MKRYKVLLIGCGQLGSRHLQAVASLKEVGEICVVDPNAASIGLGKERLKQIPDLNSNIIFSWHQKLNENCLGGDLCVIATQARIRPQVFKKVATEYGYKKFLIEKIVSQSIEEYEDMLSFSEDKEVSTWVNCKARTFGIHKYIKSRLRPSEQITFSAIGGNHGLANNGIHEVDLFVFHDGAVNLYRSGSEIDEVLHSSKRGSQICDLSGSLYGYSDKGSKFMVSFAASHVSPDHITINSPSCRFIVDHFQKFAYESYPESDWVWRKIPINEEWQVSHMTKEFASRILEEDNCELPTLRDCYPAHKFILRELLPHFNRLLNRQDNYCPIT